MRNAKCNYWTFKQSDGHCFLKQSLDKIELKDGHISGAKRCVVKDKETKIESKKVNNSPRQLQISFISEPCLAYGHGIDLTTSNLAAKDSSKPEDCQLQCAKDYKCKFFTFSNKVSINCHILKISS